MAKSDFPRNLLWVTAGFMLGVIFVSGARRPAEARANAPAEDTVLQTDVAHLKDIVPPASHPMVDVGYHAANLWFAAQKKNWPLATYYWGETRNRLRWEVRLNPGPKGPAGVVDLKSTLEGIENGSLATLKQTIDKKDSKAFVTAYKGLLEDCYSCHMSVGRPYLRPMVPLTPQQPIINTDPAATWPQ
jgi:hypothetical protein